MARPHKIAILGASGFDFTSSDFKVVSARWDRLERLGNLADYDTIVMSLLSPPSYDGAQRAMFRSKINSGVTDRVLGHNGRIIVIGDPRIPVPRGNGQEEIQDHFLDWSGMSFSWSSEPGDSVEISYQGRRPQYAAYLTKLRRFNYSLAVVLPNLEALAGNFDVGNWNSIAGCLRLDPFVKLGG